MEQIRSCILKNLIVISLILILILPGSIAIDYLIDVEDNGKNMMHIDDQ